MVLAKALFVSLTTTGVLNGLPPATCVWGDLHADERCGSAAVSWDGRYPNCSLFQYANRTVIPCSGSGPHFCQTSSPRPRPGSWHVHVFFPNSACGNCSASFRNETEGRSFAGAMLLRASMAEVINRLAERAKGQPLADRIDARRAAVDLSYDQCIGTYGIAAGAPACFHSEPCIYEVDAVKEEGPFTDPVTGAGYPNYSFLVPGEIWMPGLLPAIRKWLVTHRGAYDVLIHPNTGCEVRDHTEEASIDWLGRSYALLPKIFSCNALGCNQACAKRAKNASLPPPAYCR